MHDQLNEAAIVRDKEIDATRKAEKESRIFQEQLQDMRRRETELLHKYKQSVSLGLV